MGRQKKEHTAITIKMDQDVYNALSEYCELSGQSKTTAIERSLKMFIQQYEIKENVRIISQAKEDNE